MTVAEIDFVLTAIKDNLVGGGNAGGGFFGAGYDSLDDVPVERVDRENSTNLDKAGNVPDLDGPIHEHSDDLTRGTNFVGAALATNTGTPIGTEYDRRDERVVGVRIEGAHVSEWGSIDPYHGTADETSRDYETCRWDDLVQGIRWSILHERTFPDAGRPTFSFTHLELTNEQSLASNYGDYYRYDFDVVLTGFEALP